MIFRVQDPDDPQAPRLLEELVEATRSATSGAAIFSYARANGVELLLKDQDFAKFLKRGKFELVVGVDGVTDIRALDRLREIADEVPNLSVRVFVHDRRAVTFHPKFCWFASTDDGVAIVGSGNLTLGGLTRNWEAFSVLKLDRTGRDEVRTAWREWQKRHVTHLRTVMDPGARSRAMRNKSVRRDRNFQDDIPEPEAAKVDSPVFIAEIPGASTRWKQANFDKASFEDFFEAAQPNRRLLLWHVKVDGSISSEPEVRRGVSVKSKNFRVELGAAAGLGYPKTSRPIAIFIRTATREFLYMLLMPGKPHYDQAASILGAHAVSRANQVKRAHLDVKTLRKEWPKSPLWKHLKASN